jgi:hypothetical protein
MRYASCPTAIIEVPVDRVWTLLTAPAGWGDVFDMRLIRVDPPGPAAVGQVIRGETGLEILHLRLAFRMLAVDEAQHCLRMSVDLPFGLVVDEEIRCTPLDRRRCRVAYRCNFDFPRGWRGAALRALLARRLDSGPADSLSRLKSAAEKRFYGL